MQENNNEKYLIGEEFQFSLQLYLNYVQRKIKRDENYTPHPLVRALALAFEAANKKGIAGNYMGLSGNAEKYEDGVPRQSFAVVIQKYNNGTYSILDITDLTQGKKVPIEVGISVLTLSVKLDKLPGETVTPFEAAKLINETIPQLNMIPFNNKEWLEARDYFKSVLENGSFSITENISHIADLFSEIKHDTKWENYPSQVRTIIGRAWVLDRYPELVKDDCINITITTPEGIIRKEKVLEDVLILLYGEPAKYFTDKLAWTFFSDLNEPTTNSRKSFKISRNDPCPCGSGDKYKKCCGKV